MSDLKRHGRCPQVDVAGILLVIVLDVLLTLCLAVGACWLVACVKDAEFKLLFVLKSRKMLFIYWSSSRHCKYGGVNCICHGVTIEFFFFFFFLMWWMCEDTVNGLFWWTNFGGGVQFVLSEPFSSSDLRELLCIASPPFSAGNLMATFSAASFLSFLFGQLSVSSYMRTTQKTFAQGRGLHVWGKLRSVRMGTTSQGARKTEKKIQSLFTLWRWMAGKAFYNGLRLYMSSFFSSFGSVSGYSFLIT